MVHNIIIGRNEVDMKKLGMKGLIFIGKNYVKMGQTTSLSSNIYLDVNNAHVILVSGKRGCLTGDTLVFTDKGYKKIMEFNEDKDKILSFDKEKKKFEWEKAELLKYDIKKEELIKCELSDGRSINLTKEHPLLMNYGKYIFWRMANQLKLGDKIIIPTELPEVKKDKESIRVARILGFVLSDGTLSKRKGRWKDGRGAWYNGTKSRLRVFNNCPEVLELAKQDLEKEFGLHVKRYKRNDCNCEVIQSLHAPVVDKLHKLGVPLGNKSGIIRIPEIVWRSSNKFKKNFISALFSCDGYIKNSGGCIDYSSKSKEFLKDLQLLLSHFNIESVIRIKNVKFKGKIYKNYRLFITDNFSVNNFKKIDFFNPFKQERLKKHTKKVLRKRKTFYYADTLVCKKIKSIEKLKDVKEVYDLSVDKNHSFIANGIISHNSGKSYCLSVIAEEIIKLHDDVKKNLAVLILDTMGIFWSMKYPNLKQEDELKIYNLKPQGLDVKVYTPKGKFDEYKKKNIPTDFNFSIKPSELDASDWCNVFNIELMDDKGVLIERVIGSLKGDYDIDDMIKEISKDKKSTTNIKNAVENRFRAAKVWGLFDKAGTKIKDIIKPGEVSILDVSCYTDWNIKCLVIGILSKKLLQERMNIRKLEEMESIEEGQHYFDIEKKKREMPMVWILIDEGHEFLPREGKTAASDALIQILREGRQPGISLVLATQQPGEIARDVMTQSDIVISFRVTAKLDIEALNSIMQTYLTGDILSYLNDLPRIRGSAIILDDNSERIYPFKTRPKLSWHGGDAPSAVRVKKNILDLGI